MAGTAIVLSGCAAVRSPNPDQAAPAPGRSYTPAEPPATKQPTAPLERDAAEAPPMGLDVRYVDRDGEFTTLRVKDFPR